MTAEGARDFLLRTVGIETASHAPSWMLTEIMEAINAAMQKLHGLGPAFWAQEPRTYFVNGPTALTGITATNGSKTISGVTTWASWMLGCTTLISGDGNENEFKSQTLVVNPYIGTTGASKTAQVWGDCLTLDTDVEEIMSPVLLLGYHELVPVTTRRELVAVNQNWGNNTNYGLAVTMENGLSNRAVDVPKFCLVENAIEGGVHRLRIRLSPLPAGPYNVRFEARLTAQRITAFDSTEIRVPGDRVESIFKPVAEYEFSSCKHYEGDRILIREKHDGALSQFSRKGRPQKLTPIHTRMKKGW